MPARRILVVAQDFPWPATSGSLLRLKHVLDALGEAGEIDLFALVHSERQDGVEVPDGTSVVRHRTAVYREAGFGPVHRLRWLIGGGPIEIASRDFGPARAQFDTWIRPPYDLVWFSKAVSYAVLGGAELGPQVIDLDDLEDLKSRARREHTGARRLAATQARLNERRWRSTQRRAAALSQAVVVCSDLDAGRSGLPRVTVVPNGYDAPRHPAGRITTHEPPTVLLQGMLSYPPNADAALWFTHEILPRLRELVPRVVLRLVGATRPDIEALHQPPGVVVVGRVPDMAAELARCDLVVAPLRYGSGTRVKIIEAFAHRVPVVATTLGAEGLGAKDGRHLLLADDPVVFAAQCARLITDPDLRAELADAGQQLFLDKHEAVVTREAVLALVDRLTAPGPGRA